MDETEVWAAIDRGRTQIVRFLEVLSPAQWETLSLCDGWRVRDVAGHLTMPLLSTPRLLGLALRFPGNTNRLIRDGSIHLANAQDTDLLVGRLRTLVGNRRTFPGLGARDALLDMHAHAFDMTIPLGMPMSFPPSDLEASADLAISYLGHKNGKVFRSLTWPRYRLVATDHEWTTGEGEEVTGTMADLFLLTVGRTPRLASLRGAGADALRNDVVAAA